MKSNDLFCALLMRKMSLLSLNKQICNDFVQTSPSDVTYENMHKTNLFALFGPCNVLSVNSQRIDIFKSYIVHITVRGNDNIVRL